MPFPKMMPMQKWLRKHILWRGPEITPVRILNPWRETVSPLYRNEFLTNLLSPFHQPILLWPNPILPTKTPPIQGPPSSPINPSKSSTVTPNPEPISTLSAPKSSPPSITSHQTSPNQTQNQIKNPVTIISQVIPSSNPSPSSTLILSASLSQNLPSTNPVCSPPLLIIPIPG